MEKSFVFFCLNLPIRQTRLIIPTGYRPIAQVNALCGGLMNFTTIAALRTFSGCWRYVLTVESIFDSIH